MFAKSVIVAVFLLGAAYAQLDADQEQAVNTALENLPPELQGKVDKTQIEEIKNKSAAAFKDKCAKNGGPDAFGNAEKAFINFKSCMEGLVVTSELEKEIEAAKPNGKMDEVFKKYCAKKPQFKNCFKEAVEAARPCFSADEQKNLKIVYNVTEQLAEFVCFKDGDRIALFIAEGGIDCMQAQQEALQNCTTETLGSNVQLNANISADSIPEIKFTNKECGQLTELQHCVVQKLETCEQPTTANIVESLFKFIRKATPCKDFTDQQATPKASSGTVDAAAEKNKPGSASGLAVTSLSLVMAAATILV
ncbi:27 kDa hemolymph protein-like isoform X1 [Leguminivora glycinivorella]|uniref:27 kDa hemolymph protein-like isoform X1 n=1 Tax=Leguminivora glycinivorella TaxID=1035111 RepID=UPI00200C26D8|nr:27 kDa hemolymph protein-like isoform X1 [Leguminivora glycinivorella]